MKGKDNSDNYTTSTSTSSGVSKFIISKHFEANYTFVFSVKYLDLKYNFIVTLLLCLVYIFI